MDLKNFRSNFLVNLFISSVLMLTLILRIVFNMKKMSNINSIEMDVFIKGDVIFSIVSVLVFYMISIMEPSAFLKGNET